MLFTKEFYDIMESFEKYAKQNVRMGSMGLEKEQRDHWRGRWYYCDGLANDAFKLFLAGYSLGKTV